MTEQKPQIEKRIAATDSQLAAEKSPLQGSQIRHLSQRRLARRRLAGICTVLVAAATVSFSLLNFENTANEPRADRNEAAESVSAISLAKIADDEDAAAQRRQLRQRFQNLKQELDLLRSESVLLELQKKLEFRTSFPDSLESISASNHAARKYFSTVKNSTEDQPELRNQRLQDLVSLFPGTLAAEQAESLLQ